MNNQKKNVYYNSNFIPQLALKYNYILSKIISEQINIVLFSKIANMY